MFTGVRLGKTDFEQLSRTLFNVVPTAESLDITFAEVTASLAAMTAQGRPTSVATTQLNQLFVNMSKSGTELSKRLDELTGKSLSELTAEGRTASSVLVELRESAESDQEFRDLFGSVEAMNAALALTSEVGAAKFNQAFEAMNESAGAAAAAFAVVDDAASRDLKGSLNALNIVLLETGNHILPTVAKVLDENVFPATVRFAEYVIANREGIAAGFEAAADAVSDLADEALDLGTSAFEAAKGLEDEFATAVDVSRTALETATPFAVSFAAETVVIATKSVEAAKGLEDEFAAAVDFSKTALETATPFAASFASDVAVLAVESFDAAKGLEDEFASAVDVSRTALETATPLAASFASDVADLAVESFDAAKGLEDEFASAVDVSRTALETAAPLAASFASDVADLAVESFDAAKGLEDEFASAVDVSKTALETAAPLAASFASDVADLAVESFEAAKGLEDEFASAVDVSKTALETAAPLAASFKDDLTAIAAAAITSGEGLGEAASGGYADFAAWYETNSETVVEESRKLSDRFFEMSERSVTLTGKLQSLVAVGLAKAGEWFVENTELGAGLWDSLTAATDEFTETVLPKIETTLNEKVSPAIDAIGAKVTASAEEVVPLLSDAWDVASAAMSNAADDVVPVLSGTFDKLSTAITTSAEEKIPVLTASLQDTLAPAFENLTEKIRENEELISDTLVAGYEIAAETATNAATAFASMAESGLDLIAESIETLVMPQLALFQGWFEENPDTISETTASMSEAVAANFEAMTEAAENIVAVFGENLTPVFDTVLDWWSDNGPQITSFVESVARVFASVAEEVGRIVGELVEEVMPRIERILEDVVLPALATFAEWFEEHEEEISGAINVIADALSILLDVAGVVVDGLITVLGPLVTFVFESSLKILGYIIGLIDKIDEIDDAVDAAVDAWKDGWNEVLGFFEGWSKKIVKLVDDTVGKIVDRIKEMVEDVKDAIEDVPIIGDAVGAVGSVVQGVRSIIPGLAEGGMVTGPTLAMIGEDGPEAVVPLDQMPRFGSGGDVYVTVVVEGNINSDRDEFEDVVHEAMTSLKVRGVVA